MKGRKRSLALATALSLALLPPLLLPLRAAAGGCGDTPGRWHLHGEASLEFSPRIEAVGLWRQGPKAPPPALQVKADRAAAAVGASGDGRSIIDFERYELDGEPYYAFVFEAGEAAEKLLSSLADGAAVTTAIADQGDKHLEDFEAYREDGAWRFAALFREGAADRTFETGVAGSQVQAKLTSRHLKDFEVLDKGPGQPTFALLLASGHQDQIFHPSLRAKDFHDLVHQLHESNDGAFRLKDVEVWKSDLGETRFSALFEKNAFADHLWVSPCGLHCDQKDSFDITVEHTASRVEALQTKKSALRLVDIELPLDREAAPQRPAGKNKKGPGLGAAPLKNTAEKGGLPLGDVPPDDQCSHSAVLHDAGTNGPP